MNIMNFRTLKSKYLVEIMVGRVWPRVQMMLKNGVGTRQISFALMGFFPAPPTARILRQKQPACKLLGKYF